MKVVHNISPFIYSNFFLTQKMTFWFGQEQIIIPNTYHVIEPCGEGTYGFVFSATNSEGEKVAIKKMKGVLSKSATARRFLRELIVLKHLSHDNILPIRDLIVPELRNGRDIYVVYEMMDSDLASVLKSKQQISLSQIRLIFYQLMRGLKYMHSVGVIHRDLKPRNLLINSNCDLKIADFGLVRLETGTPQMTEYVCTRWYRAPEMLYDRPAYDCKVDIFSAGCVLGELMALKPLLPGANSNDQLELTLRRMGPVHEADMTDVPPGFYFDFITATNKKVQPAGDIVKYLFGDMTESSDRLEIISVMRDMLHFNWSKRATATEILRHSFFKNLRMVIDEPICEIVLLSSEWKNDHNTPHLSEIYSKIQQEAIRIQRKILKRTN